MSGETKESHEKGQSEEHEIPMKHFLNIVSLEQGFLQLRFFTTVILTVWVLWTSTWGEEHNSNAYGSYLGMSSLGPLYDVLSDSLHKR
jgi:hypothetical protein